MRKIPHNVVKIFEGGRTVKKRMLSLALSLSLLLCSACAPAAEPEPTPPELTYTATTVSYGELFGEYSFIKFMDRAETERAVYYFETTVGEDQRLACATATEQILSKLGALAEKPSIAIFDPSTYDSVNIVENTLYAPVRTWKSMDYAMDVLLAACGQCGHYGLAYGYANRLSDRFGWAKSIKGSFAAPENQETCDLNLLCFDPAFVSEADVLTAQKLSCDFVNSYIKANGEEAFQALLLASDTAEGMEAVSAALGEYYQGKGLTYTPSTLRFGYGGEVVDYVVRSDLGTFHVGADWVDDVYEISPNIHKNFLHENYGEAKEFFTVNLQLMQSYQELFGLDGYNNKLSIAFPNHSLQRDSFYASGPHKITLLSAISLQHEYIHSLTMPRLEEMELWKVEGFAQCFEFYYYDPYRVPALNQDWNSDENMTRFKILKEYSEVMGRPLDLFVDTHMMSDLLTYYYHLKSPNSTYDSGASFVWFLINQYGMEDVVQHIYGDKRPLPKSYKELVAEWNQYIEETYQEYSRK